MHRSRLGPVVALLALTLALSGSLGVGTATATRVLPSPDQRPDLGQPTFTEAEAKDVLAEAKSQLRRDAKRGGVDQPVGAGVDTDITMTLRDLFLARTALSGRDRRQADVILARPSDTGGDDLGVGAPVAYLPQTPATPRKNVCGPRVCVHWVESTTDPEHTSATPDSNSDSVPDWVQTTLNTVEHVWDAEVGSLGYRAPRPDAASGDTNNPNTKVDIYLADLGDRGGLYGYCAPEGPVSSAQVTGYCVLDNDYAVDQYGAPPLNSLRVTAAHEFFHAIQFGYDVDEDIWFMEGTATWVEDVLYDSINDNYQYLPFSLIRVPGRSVDYSVDNFRYGSFLFFKYVEERLASSTVMRQFWEAADAPRNRYSLQAIRAVIAARNTNWTNLYTQFASWNAFPTGSYSEGAGYPPPTLTLNKTLTNSSTSTGWQTRDLRHLTSSSVRIVPSSSLSTSRNILIEINGPNKSHGTNALIQRRYRNGTVTHSMIPLSSYGNATLLRDFNRASISSMYIVVSNTSTSMQECGEVATGDGEPYYSCYGRGTYDSGQTFKVRASLR
jgi:hypothetical protein